MYEKQASLTASNNIYNVSDSVARAAEVSPQDQFVNSVVSTLVSDFSELDAAELLFAIRKGFCERIGMQIKDAERDVEEFNSRIQRRHEVIKRTMSQL